MTGPSPVTTSPSYPLTDRSSPTTAWSLRRTGRRGHQDRLYILVPVSLCLGWPPPSLPRRHDASRRGRRARPAGVCHSAFGARVSWCRAARSRPAARRDPRHAPTPSGGLGAGLRWLGSAARSGPVSPNAATVRSATAGAARSRLDSTTMVCSPPGNGGRGAHAGVGAAVPISRGGRPSRADGFGVPYPYHRPAASSTARRSRPRPDPRRGRPGVDAARTRGNSRAYPLEGAVRRRSSLMTTRRLRRHRCWSWPQKGL